MHELVERYCKRQAEEKKQAKKYLQEELEKERVEHAVTCTHLAHMTIERDDVLRDIEKASSYAESLRKAAEEAKASAAHRALVIGGHVKRIAKLEAALLSARRHVKAVVVQLHLENTDRERAREDLVAIDAALADAAPKEGT